MRNIFTLAAATVVLASCQQPKQTRVDDGYVRLAAVSGRPAAGYFVIHAGPEDSVLLSVACAFAIRSEMHETTMNGSMSSMKRIDSLPVPANTTVRFQPGGKHVMLFGLGASITPGTRVPLILTFSNGDRIQYNAASIAAGDPAPKN